jgi:hypothetical protein
VIGAGSRSEKLRHGTLAVAHVAIAGGRQQPRQRVGDGDALRQRGSPLFEARARLATGERELERGAVLGKRRLRRAQLVLEAAETHVSSDALTRRNSASVESGLRSSTSL